MSEFIREVDEEYRHDQIRALFNRYWAAILAVALLVLVGVGAWRGYVYYRVTQAESAANRYFDASDLSRDDPAKSLAGFEALGKDGPAGYRTLARFRAAAEIGRSDAAAGAKAYDALAEEAGIDADVRSIARLRAAILLMDSAEGEARRRLEPLADSNAPFRDVARELLAVAALKRGDDADAKPRLDAILADPVSTPDQRQRAGLFLALIRAGKPTNGMPLKGEAPPSEPALAAEPAPPSPTPAAP